MPRRRTVLLVEPDLQTQRVFRSALEARGFEVWAASDGVTGLALARERQPGVIVGDFPIELPDGNLFTHTVRDDERLQDAVIITVTSRNLTGKDTTAWMLSERVLSKPISPERLAEEVAWAVDRRRDPIS